MNTVFKVEKGKINQDISTSPYAFIILFLNSVVGELRTKRPESPGCQASRVSYSQAVLQRIQKTFVSS